MWVIQEKAKGENKFETVSTFSSKPRAQQLADVLNISNEKAKMLIDGKEISTPCGTYTITNHE